jgi:hypothetical protein
VLAYYRELFARLGIHRNLLVLHRLVIRPAAAIGQKLDESCRRNYTALLVLFYSIVRTTMQMAALSGARL